MIRSFNGFTNATPNRRQYTGNACIHQNICKSFSHQTFRIRHNRILSFLVVDWHHRLLLYCRWFFLASATVSMSHLTFQLRSEWQMLLLV